jgi:hypothetical protein
LTPETPEHVGTGIQLDMTPPFLGASWCEAFFATQFSQRILRLTRIGDSAMLTTYLALSYSV